MKILGWRLERWKEEAGNPVVAELDWAKERMDLKSQISFLSKQNAELKAKVETPFIDADLGDPTPVDTETRKAYVATVAGLHKDFLEPKFKFMIANVHKSMEDEHNSRKDDDMWRGAAYVLRELIRWGNRMVNEQLANQNNSK